MRRDLEASNRRCKSGCSGNLETWKMMEEVETSWKGGDITSLIKYGGVRVEDGCDNDGSWMVGGGGR